MSMLLDALPGPRRKPGLRISTDIPLSMEYSSGSPSSSFSPSTRSDPASSSLGSPHFLFRVRCMHDFESSDPVHLSFHRDEMLIVVKQEHSGWWAAMRSEGDRVGWIPSSFVLPLDGSQIADYDRPDESLYLDEDLNDPLLSAIHDTWLPVSDEDCKLMSPMDTVSYKGFADAKMLLPSHGLTDEVGYGHGRVPRTPEGLPPYITRTLPFLQAGPHPLEPKKSQLSPSATPLLDEEWYHPDTYMVDRQTSLLTTSTFSHPVTMDFVLFMDSLALSESFPGHPESDVPTELRTS